MNAKKLWCQICNKMVEVAIDESASAILVPLLGATAGGAIGKAKGGWEYALGGALVGVLASAVVHSLVPKAQRVVCGGCGTHLA